MFQDFRKFAAEKPWKLFQADPNFLSVWKRVAKQLNVLIKNMIQNEKFFKTKPIGNRKASDKAEPFQLSDTLFYNIL